MPYELKDATITSYQIGASPEGFDFQPQLTSEPTTSEGGDISPWTVTHDGGTRPMESLDEGGIIIDYFPTETVRPTESLDDGGYVIDWFPTESGKPGQYISSSGGGGVLEATSTVVLNADADYDPRLGSYTLTGDPFTYSQPDTLGSYTLTGAGFDIF